MKPRIDVRGGVWVWMVWAVLTMSGCGSFVGGTERERSDAGAIVLFRADSNVRNPEANDAYPGVRRVALRAVDGRTRRDEEVQLTDRVRVPAGMRTLRFAAETSTRTVTLSELTVTVEPGVEYFALPVKASGGATLVELRRGRYGDVVAQSTAWEQTSE